MGKAEEQVWIPKDYDCLQEIHCSKADECGHAEEIVGNDEGEVGGKEEGNIK